MFDPGSDALPRVIGRHRFTLEGASNDRAIQPYAQWMFQRPVQFYQQLSDAERARIDPLLQQTGGLDALNTTITTPLQYVGYQVRRVG